MATTIGGVTTDMSSVSYLDMAQYAANASDSYIIDEETIDESTGQKERKVIIDFDKWCGVYKRIPEYKSVVDTLVKWSLGKGIKGKDAEKIKKIVGNGRETARLVLMNQMRVAIFAGDSFAEIVRDKQGRMTNLKPLNSQTTAQIYDEKGILTRYEIWDGIKKIKNIDVKNIFHLTFGRVANEPHGTPLGQVLERLILMRNESMEDNKIMFHRFVKPIRIFYANTDNEAKLDEAEARITLAYKKTENLVIPKGTMELGETTAIPQYATLSPMEWLRHLIRIFTTACGVPEIILGWGENTTEASSKIIYIAWQQTIEDMQLWIEEIVELQLGLTIELEFPIDLMEDVKSDQKKDGKSLIKKSDTTIRANK